MWSWSFFGYAVILLIVVIVLHQLWFMRGVLIFILIFGTLGYFVTNLVVRNRDLSDGYVKKTTKMVFTKVMNTVEKTCNALEAWDNKPYDLGEEIKQEPEPEPEPEGFVTE